MIDYLYSCMKNPILTGLFVLLIPLLSYGDEFRYLRTKEGLVNGEINSIAQDSTGNMWFATWSGLIRYDGSDFQLFRPQLGDSSSLPNKKVKILFVDSEDNLWIATSTGLCWYNKRKNSFREIKFSGNEPEVNIIGLDETDKHLLVHLIDGFYIVPISKKNDINYRAKKADVKENGKNPWYYFHYSTSFKNGLLLLVSSNTNYSSNICIVKLDSSDNRFTLDIRKTIKVDALINSIEYVPVENNIYIATTDGLMPYSLEQNKFIENSYFKGRDIQKVLYASNHKLFCTLPEPNLLCLDLHTGLTSGYAANPNELGSLLPNKIQSLYEDFSGNLWVGHQGQGISIMNLYKKNFYSFKRDPLKSNSLNSNTVMCFGSTGQEVLIGCRSGGLNIIKRNETKDVSPEYLKIAVGDKDKPGAVDDGIWDIEKESDSLFWLGTDLGLFKLEKTGQRWTLGKFSGLPKIDNLIRKVFVDNNHNIWCGTFDEGLIFIPDVKKNKEGRNFRFPHLLNDSTTLSHNLVQDIYLDSKNRFWIATYYGLNRLKNRYDNLDLSGKTKPQLEFVRYIATEPKENFLNNNEINCIYENYDGSIWFATQGGGINILDPQNERFRMITINNGLPSNDVQGMLPDEDGNLWISTTNGIASCKRFDKMPYFTIFDNTDGIQNETFMVNSFYKAPDGQMFFGGDNGFTTFYPREIGINEIKPKIAFSNLSFRNILVQVGDTLSNGFFLNESINYTKKIVLPFNRSYFKLDVATLHFQQPQKNKFSYILEGYMKHWMTVPVQGNAIEFANLPHGAYTLKVKAVNSDNVASAETKQLSIVIQPPWYLTWYVVAIFFVVGFSLVMGIIYIIINRQRLIYQKQLNSVALENNENKMMFLTNIAHELRTPLSLIIAPIDDLMANSSNENQFKSQLQLIHRNSNYLLRLINQIIDFRRLSAGKLSLQLEEADIVRVVKDVVLNFKGYRNNRNVNLYLKVPAEAIKVNIDVQKIEEVLYNLISNAFKHTADNHSITVSMMLLPELSGGSAVFRKIRISVVNEGKEISEEDKSRIFERFYKIDENSEGAGIGLSFAKSLVEMHGGTIDVESFPGTGVAFHVDMPFNKIERNKNGNGFDSGPVLVQSIDSHQHQLSKANGYHPTENYRILIVEDNEELRDFLSGFFSRNCTCITAADGNEAYELVQKEKPSLVISDVIMPDMDGFSFCRKIKENLKTCHTPVILLTAKDTEDQVLKGYEVGADAYITKPFDLNLLWVQSMRLIKNRELIREKYKTQNFMVEMEKNHASKDEQFIQTVKQILDENISDAEFNVNKLSKQLNISSTQLYRKLKALTGYSPVEFIRIIKLQKAYTFLAQQNYTVKEVCYLTGFNNLSYFIKCFKDQFGATPANFRDQGIKQPTNAE